MIQKLRNDKQGFTLIELMIVIAIIGILAAIAVPQFLAYRIRSYNTSAKAVVHDAKADQANLNSELGVYGHTEALPYTLVQATAAYAVANSSSAGNTGLATPATAAASGARLAGTNISTGRDLAIGFSLGSNMICSVEDTAANPNTYLAVARHVKGDTAYGLDVDVDNTIYSVTNAGWINNTAGIGATFPTPPTISADDFVATPGGNGQPTANWTAIN